MSCGLIKIDTVITLKAYFVRISWISLAKCHYYASIFNHTLPITYIAVLIFTKRLYSSKVEVFFLFKSLCTCWDLFFLKTKLIVELYFQNSNELSTNRQKMEKTYMKNICQIILFHFFFFRRSTIIIFFTLLPED